MFELIKEEKVLNNLGSREAAKCKGSTPALELEDDAKNSCPADTLVVDFGGSRNCNGG